jgi:hypothetical protein
MDVVHALRSSIHGLLASYPTTAEEDLRLIQAAEGGEGGGGGGGGGEGSVGPILLSSYHLRYREKQILHDALNFLERHEQLVLNGSISFQLELKAQERAEADLRDAAHKRFVEEVKRRAAIRPQLAQVEVDMGPNQPKANLTLEEGRDIRQTVLEFCKKHSVQASYVETLEKALRGRIVNPPPYKVIHLFPLLLLLLLYPSSFKFFVLFLLLISSCFSSSFFLLFLLVILTNQPFSPAVVRSDNIDGR